MKSEAVLKTIHRITSSRALMFFASFCLLVNISVAMTFLNISVWLKKQIEPFEIADILYLFV